MVRVWRVMVQNLVALLEMEGHGQGWRGIVRHREALTEMAGAVRIGGTQRENVGTVRGGGVQREVWKNGKR